MNTRLSWLYFMSMCVLHKIGRYHQHSTNFFFLSKKMDYFNRYTIIPIYLIRTGIMNSTYALNESILMDYVPKETRARWKSLESVASFGWCGSAVLGGVLSDAQSYSSTFLYTAGLQFLGTVVITLLVSIVPIEEKKTNGEEGGAREEEALIDSTTAPQSSVKIRTSGSVQHHDLEEPLLS